MLCLADCGDMSKCTHFAFSYRLSIVSLKSTNQFCVSAVSSPTKNQNEPRLYALVHTQLFGIFVSQ